MSQKSNFLSVEQNGLEFFESKEKLIKHNNELRQLLYTISHNIKGPIANLKGLLNLMTPESIGSENIDILRRIERSVSALDANVDDFTHIIDVQNNVTEIYQRFPLQKEVDLICILLEQQIADNDISIKVDISDSYTIYSVRPLLRSILFNLISNSIKYRSNKRKPEIQISVTPTDGKMCIRVKDNGIGINLPLYKNQLFELYKRFSGTNVQGRGVGLFLVKLQVDTLKGSIEVDSTLGEGTCFTIQLPIPKQVEKQLILKNSAGAIYFDAGLNCINTSWQEKSSSEDFREIIKRVNSLAKVYQYTSWIFNLDYRICQHLLSSDSDSRQDLQFNLNTPLRQIILLAPKHGEKKVNAQLLQETLEKMFFLPVQCFADKNNARRYLKNNI